jgi:hypothetical protein
MKDGMRTSSTHGKSEKLYENLLRKFQRKDQRDGCVQKSMDKSVSYRSIEAAS